MWYAYVLGETTDTLHRQPPRLTNYSCPDRVYRSRIALASGHSYSVLWPLHIRCSLIKRTSPTYAHILKGPTSDGLMVLRVKALAHPMFANSLHWPWNGPLSHLIAQTQCKMLARERMVCIYTFTEVQTQYNRIHTPTGIMRPLKPHRIFRRQSLFIQYHTTEYSLNYNL